MTLESQAVGLLLIGRSTLKHLEHPKDYRCAEGCLRSSPARAVYVTPEECLHLPHAFLKEWLCLSSSMQLSEMSEDKKCLSARRLPDTYVTRNLASALCQMSRIKQYGYSISSAILVPCA